MPVPNVYSQLLIQLVFAVKYRQRLITAEMRIPLEKYITGIVTQKGHKLLAVYCMPDHCHILIGLNPNQSISDLVRDIKSNSSRWLNEEFSALKKFRWQNGYGAFSYSNDRLEMMVNYVLNQASHHNERSFLREFNQTLNNREIEYSNEYLFNSLED